MSAATKLDAKELDRQYAIEQLLTHYIKEGDTIYTILRRVSSSGMSRAISLKIVRDGRIDDITFNAAHALGWPLIEVNGSRAIRVTGTGMDMGFHTVYTLSRVLFRPVVTGTDKDPGYLLEHRWI